MTGPLATLDLALLALFTAGAFVAVAAVVVLSANVPVGSSGAPARGLLGSALTIGTLLAILCLVAALATAAAGLPAAVVVIAIGLAVLWAPWFAEFLPDAVRRSRIGLGAAAIACLASVALLQPVAPIV